MGEKNVYIDHFHERTSKVIGIRQMFNSLAFELLAENKVDSAKQVLNKLDQIMPDWQFPYFDESVITTAIAHYQAKEFEKGNELLTTYAENLIDEIEWFSSLQPQKDFYKQVESDMIDYTKTILQIYHIGEQFGQKDLCKQLDLRWTEAVGYGLDVYLKN
jgi:hypothetical protein